MAKVWGHGSSCLIKLSEIVEATKTKSVAVVKAEWITILHNFKGGMVLVGSITNSCWPEYSAE